MRKTIKATQHQVQYYTWTHNIEGCLRNGSFVRNSKYGLAQYMNGDFMGFIENVPEGMSNINPEEAKNFIPECCR